MGQLRLMKESLDFASFVLTGNFDIDWEKVVKTFATENNRGMALINIMDDGNLIA